MASRIQTTVTKTVGRLVHELFLSQGLDDLPRADSCFPNTGTDPEGQFVEFLWPPLQFVQYELFRQSYGVTSSCSNGLTPSRTRTTKTSVRNGLGTSCVTRTSRSRVGTVNDLSVETINNRSYLRSLSKGKEERLLLSTESYFKRTPYLNALLSSEAVCTIVMIKKLSKVHRTPESRVVYFHREIFGTLTK